MISFLYNNVTQSFFSRESACAKETTSFTIKNCIEKSIHYSVIVQRMDGWNLKMEFIYRYFSFISNGFRDREYNFRVFNRQYAFLSYFRKTYCFLIHLQLSNAELSYSSFNQEEEDKLIDMFEITLKSSSPSLKAYLSPSAYPMNRNRHELKLNTTTQESIIQVDFTSPLYSINHDIYVYSLQKEIHILVNSTC